MVRLPKNCRAVRRFYAASSNPAKDNHCDEQLWLVIRATCIGAACGPYGGTRRSLRSVAPVGLCLAIGFDGAPFKVKTLGRIVGVPSLWPRSGGVLQHQGLGVPVNLTPNSPSSGSAIIRKLPQRSVLPQTVAESVCQPATEALHTRLWLVCRSEYRSRRPSTGSGTAHIRSEPLHPRP